MVNVIQHKCFPTIINEFEFDKGIILGKGSFGIVKKC